MSRVNIGIYAIMSPEATYFKILTENVSAVFLELEDVPFDGPEVITSLCSLDKQVEVILVASMDYVNGLGHELLRGCFGVISPAIRAPSNCMVLNQLTHKLGQQLRMDALKSSSINDGLTQLHNHAHIQHQLDEEIEHLKPGECLSVVMLDLDHFKNYNDINGHPAGDDVLRKIAEILEKSVRKLDYAARYGGEEFLMVFPGANLWTCLQVAERIRCAIANTDFEFGHNQPMGFVSASFGAAMFDNGHITDKATLINVADKALYMAKRGDRNCLWYYQNGDYHQYQPTGRLQVDGRERIT